MPQDDAPVLRLKKIECIDLANGLGRGSDSDEAKLARGRKEFGAIRRIKVLNLVQEKRDDTLAFAQVALKDEEIREHLDHDCRSIGLDLPKVLISVCDIVRPDNGELQ
jgi:hypothetical protein